MSDSPEASVQVLGADSAKKGLRGADAAMKREIRAQFKAIGRVVADEAQSIAETKMTSRSRRLVRGIRPMATSMKVVVRDATKSRKPWRKTGKPYNYPKRHEYEKDGARAFMRPALRNKTSEVMRRMQVVVAKMAVAFKLPK